MRATLRQATGAAGWIVAVCVGGGPLGCGKAERPAPVEDRREPEPEPENSLVEPEALKPDLMSPCGAATVGLDYLRPNLYFAIDASGSMREGIPAGDTSAASLGALLPPNDRYAALSFAIQRLLERVGHRVNYGATLFPTADVGCDAGEEVLGLTRGDEVSFALSGKPGPVLNELMFSINRRTPRGGTPVAAALSGILPKLRNQGSETYVFLVTDGGPNCDPGARCGADACIPNLERAQLAEDVFCEAPINCCDPGLFGGENCLDAYGSLLAVDALARAGVRTFVIGIPGSDAFGTVLDQLALGGGMGRPGTPSYYRVSDAADLIETVRRLGLGIASSCTIELAEPPPDPALVNVFFDGNVLPADPVDGWTFRDAQTVQLVGSSCALFQAGDVLQADIVAGCPSVIR
jgi:hypothetical protein